MSTPQEEIQCVLWLTELQFLTAVQRRVRKQYGRQPPTRESIRFWSNKLRSTRSLLRVKSPGKTRASEENVNRIRGAFQRSPRKSIRAASFQLHTNYTFNSERCATQKAPPKSVQDSNDLCNAPSSTHILPCGNARKN
jgi:hypothetical protein